MTEWAIGQILRTKIHEPQTYRSCLGTLALAKKYGDDRLENAAIRCQTAGKATYSKLRNNLLKASTDRPIKLIFSPRRSTVISVAPQPILNFLIMTTASLSSLRDLKLGGMASAYEAILATPLDQHPEAHDRRRQQRS